MKITYAKAKTSEEAQKLFKEFTASLRPKENWFQRFVRKLFRLK